MIELVRSLLSAEAYQISKFAEVGPPERLQYQRISQKVSNVKIKYHKRGEASGNKQKFALSAREEAATGNKKDTIFVDSVVQQIERRDRVLYMLEEHIQRNIVKIGKRFYRQSAGIPQGSVVSSLLCNFFYAALERDCFGFLTADSEGSSSVLLRLIDDFLLISTRRDHAEKFLQIMHDGRPEYGVEVKHEKTRVNFDVRIGGQTIQCSGDTTKFQYCGILIDTVSLDIAKDVVRRGTGSKLNSIELGAAAC